MHATNSIKKQVFKHNVCVHVFNFSACQSIYYPLAFVSIHVQTCDTGLHVFALSETENSINISY